MDVEDTKFINSSLSAPPRPVVPDSPPPRGALQAWERREAKLSSIPRRQTQRRRQNWGGASSVEGGTSKTLGSPQQRVVLPAETGAE